MPFVSEESSNAMPRFAPFDEDDDDEEDELKAVRFVLLTFIAVELEVLRPPVSSKNKSRYCLNNGNHTLGLNQSGMHHT